MFYFYDNGRANEVGNCMKKDTGCNQEDIEKEGNAHANASQEDHTVTAESSFSNNIADNDMMACYLSYDNPTYDTY